MSQGNVAAALVDETRCVALSPSLSLTVGWVIIIIFMMIRASCCLSRSLDAIFMFVLTNFEDVAVIFCTFYCVSDFSESAVTGCMITRPGRLRPCVRSHESSSLKDVPASAQRTLMNWTIIHACRPSKPILRHRVLHLMAYCHSSLHTSLYVFLLHCIQMVTLYWSEANPVLSVHTDVSESSLSIDRCQPNDKTVTIRCFCFF